MRNTFTISSIANVISRFSVKATVMLRNSNTEPATWPHNCAGPIIGRGKRDALEPVLLGNSSLTLTGRYSEDSMYAKRILQSLLNPLRFLQPAIRQPLFQRIS